MIGNYDNVDPSDVFNTEQLRQSELISRLTSRVEGDLCAGGPIVGVISRAISQWLLDNDLHIVRR